MKIRKYRHAQIEYKQTHCIKCRCETNDHSRTDTDGYGIVMCDDCYKNSPLLKIGSTKNEI